MKDIRSDPSSTAKGGNSTKRIRIATGFGGSSRDLAKLLGGVAMQGDLRSTERLPAAVQRRATPEYVWRAVQQYIQGDVHDDPFGPSTDYDLIAERAPGLAKAKKAQYRRTHGQLSCERCGLDPVTHYGTKEAEACIEVHHSATHVSEMAKGHKTTLDDLQCLCANCHRLVHKILSVQKKKG
jgi:hypothetical protein